MPGTSQYMVPGEGLHDEEPAEGVYETPADGFINQADDNTGTPERVRAGGWIGA